MADRHPPSRRRERAAFRRGARSIGATALGTAAWGLVTGVALVKGGLSPLQALGMVMLVYSGTAQLAALPLMSAGAALPAIWLTALLANLRFLIYSAVVANEFRGLPLASRLGLGWLTTDTGLAAYLGRGAPAGGTESVRERAARFVGTNALVYAGWTAGTAVGVIGAGLIPDSPRIGFIGELAVIALVGPLLSSRAALVAAVAAGTVAVLGSGWPLRLGMFAAIGAGVAVALAMPAAPIPSGGRVAPPGGVR